jgi:hypothetical protein
MPQLLSKVVAYAWAHPLTLIGILLVLILYARVMSAGPRQG